MRPTLQVFVVVLCLAAVHICSVKAVEHELQNRLELLKKHHRRARRRPSVPCDGVHGVVRIDRKTDPKKPKYSFVQACVQTPGPDDVAWARYDDNIMKTGWGELSIRTNGKFDDIEQAYGAGYIEGALTTDRIYQMSQVIDLNHKDAYGYFDRQDAFIRSRIVKVNKDSKSPDHIYWYNVALVLAQLDGLIEGYNDNVPAEKKISKHLFWLINSDGDILDIERVPNHDKEPIHKRARDMSEAELLDFISTSGRCSALLKWVPGKDLFAGHTTWDDYTELYRFYKHYDFQFRHPAIKSHGSSFSSYPGFISSSDDFYITDTALVIIETTLNILNEDLYDPESPDTTLVAWIRNIVANRLAYTGPEWANVFKQLNSGTYNDHWMILDYKLFEPTSTSLKPHTLTVLEQIPGYVEVKDMTDALSQKHYWASYNRPYFNEVKKRSLFQYYEQKHGDMFSFDNSPRAKIFRRDHKKVHDDTSMQKMMMYNDWQNDPYSLGCPGNAIASRFDIDSPHCDLRVVANGATDAKFTRSAWVGSRQSSARAGPTHDDQPAFSWDNPQFADEYHEGLPTVWNFDWQVMKPAQLGH